MTLAARLRSAQRMQLLNAAVQMARDVARAAARACVRVRQRHEGIGRATTASGPASQAAGQGKAQLPSHYPQCADYSAVLASRRAIEYQRAHAAPISPFCTTNIIL